MPKRVDHALRRRQITDAVARITVRGGLGAATFREVATEAGVSVRLIQYYFGSKSELMLATQRRVSERAVARIQARRAGGGESPRQVLLAVLGSFIPTDDESREIMLLFVALHTATLVDPTLFRPEALDVPRALQATIAAQLARADLGDRPVEPEAAILAGLVPSLAQAVLDGLDTAETALEVLAYAIDRALGLTPP